MPYDANGVWVESIVPEEKVTIVSPGNQTAPNDPAGLMATSELYRSVAGYQYEYVVSGNQILRKLKGYNDAGMPIATKDTSGQWLFNNSQYNPITEPALLTAAGLGNVPFSFNGQTYKIDQGKAKLWDAKTGTFSLQSLSDKAQLAYDEAKAANIELKGELRGGYSNRLNTGMSMLEGAGKQEAADIESSYGKLGASQQQDLTSRGFAGTTIMPTMKAGVERQKTDALARLGERMRQERLGTYTGLTGDLLASMERETNTYPSWETLERLSGNVGASGG